ncbi:hypothetical protein X759_04850 [Mesorhizobium sp. LSHC420B00]|nr:hypothetical protein X759_04850 [Mesorhizobium sp. LSHC420B00]
MPLAQPPATSGTFYNRNTIRFGDSRQPEA